MRSHFTASARIVSAFTLALAMAGCGADDTPDVQNADHVAIDATAIDRTPAPDVPPPPFDSAMDCPGHLTCDDCREQGCGWCTTSSQCIPGNATGSFDGRCTGASWAYTLDQCPVPDGSASGTDAVVSMDAPRG